MSEDQRAAFGEMENEAKLNLLYSLGLFPACGHHRVVASKELAEDGGVDRGEGDCSSGWCEVGVVCPDFGFLRQPTLRDPIVVRRADEISAPRVRHSVYAPKRLWFQKPGSGPQRPAQESRGNLADTPLPNSDKCDHLLVRPPAIYTLINRILVGDVKNPEIPFCTLVGPTTLHHLAPLPDDMVESLLLQVIDRKIGLAEANIQAKNVRALCCAMRFLRTLEPARTKDMIDWDHFTKVWPTLEEVADKARGYWLNQKGRLGQSSCQPWTDRSKLV